MRESSEVLARKYRPKNFDELIGQESIAQTLSLALDVNRLSHAYLFSGLRGSGKTSTARIFAKALICEEGVSHQPCGKCQNCIMAIENRHMDIIEMDGASSRKIDDIRDLVEQTKYQPSIARYKIFIIDEVHMLTKEAFNALLKTLEEPPSYVKFILATTDPLKLPATILSRTQHFRFKSIATNKIVEHLMYILNLENVTYEKDALEILARSGGGSLRDTLTLLDQAIIYSKNHVDSKTVTDMLGLVDPQFIEKIFEAVFNKDHAQLVEYVKTLEDYESEMVIDELIAYLKDRLFSNDALFSTLILERFFRILSESKYLFSINADGSFVLSLVFFKMVEALKVKEIDDMIESMQKEISTTQSTPPQTQKTIKIQSTTPEKAPEAIQEKEIIAQTPQISLFNTLVEKISDRNSELGDCFREKVEFISFENDTLTWESCADEECKKLLKHGYGVIKQFVREIFGFNTKITHVPCSKTITKPTKQPEGMQSASTVADIEMATQSCIPQCNDEAIEEQKMDIRDEEMVKKAIELFEVKKQIIKPNL